ncbi:MAG: hypothetical protein ACRCWQ_10840 [Bacilli bacterium]
MSRRIDSFCANPHRKKADQIRDLMKANQRKIVDNAVARIYARIEVSAVADEPASCCVCSIKVEENHYLEQIISKLREEGFSVSQTETNNRFTINVIW